MNKKIYIVTVDRFFGQSIPTEKSLDTSLLQQEFKKFGHETELIDIEDVANGVLDENAIYLFGSHQNADIKRYIDDVVSIRFLHQPYKCIPPAQYILAHENKGIQAMLATQLGLDLSQQTYHYRSDHKVDRMHVAKLVDGAGSNGVFIAQPGHNLRKRLQHVGFKHYRAHDIAHIFKGFIKKAISHKHYTPDYIAYNNKYWRHVRQDLLSGSNHDFKILVFYDRYFVLKRNVRPNDFRSSGSGLFEFVEPPAGLLDAAQKIFKKINSPMASLDIIHTADEYKCLEFQCAHFGPYTQIFSPHIYQSLGSTFVKRQNFGTTEHHLSYAVSTAIGSMKS